MSLPWWLTAHAEASIERVLRALAEEERIRLNGTDADIANRLLRNGYVRAELESAVVGIDGPLALELRSRGLTDLGAALLARMAEVNR